jgi:hypothetical protein
MNRETRSNISAINSLPDAEGFLTQSPPRHCCHSISESSACRMRRASFPKHKPTRATKFLFITKSREIENSNSSITRLVLHFPFSIILASTYYSDMKTNGWIAFNLHRVSRMPEMLTKIFI